MWIRNVDNFRALFKQLREKAGLSQNALARRMGVNPAYVNRLEKSGQGATNRELVELAARALELDDVETDLLLAAAGHLPAAFEAAGVADPTLLLVASALSDRGLPEDDKQELRTVIQSIVRHWREAAGSRAAG